MLTKYRSSSQTKKLKKLMAQSIVQPLLTVRGGAMHDNQADFHPFGVE